MRFDNFRLMGGQKQGFDPTVFAVGVGGTTHRVDLNFHLDFGHLLFAVKEGCVLKLRCVLGSTHVLIVRILYQEQRFVFKTDNFTLCQGEENKTAKLGVSRVLIALWALRQSCWHHENGVAVLKGVYKRKQQSTSP